MTPAIFGVEGLVVSDVERDFFRESEPVGYILFGRNVADREQLRRLTDQLRAISGVDKLPILIDQEGGRVARMQAPEWLKYPPAASFERLWTQGYEAQSLEACALNYEALALDLAEVGISVTCAPVLDVPVLGAHDVIGDRAFSHIPGHVTRLGEACLRGLDAGGIAGVVKHIPGHGRAVVDSHVELPRVDAPSDELWRDLEPFSALSHATMAMTAHVIYECWDAEHCATLSPFIIDEIIRKQIGFGGLLMSDDLDMKALHGDVGELAAQAQKAGCDVVLNCWAKLHDMLSIAEKMASPSATTITRINSASEKLATFSAHPNFGSQQHIGSRQRALIARRDALLA